MMTESAKLTVAEAEAAIESFQSIIRFPTVSSLAPTSGAYNDCAAYLLSQLRSVSCLAESAAILDESPEKCPVVVARWEGLHPDWPVIILNSHYDVVPAPIDEWTVDPFGAERKDGKIYGRGAQDMKCVCIQYIESIRKLNSINPKFKPQRTIHLTFVPDEEVGGSGMQAFLSSTLYKSMPGIAIALDEGLASMDDTYSLFYGERLPWWVEVTATGKTGHGSRFIDSTAVEQIIGVTNRALAFRSEQRDLLHGTNGAQQQHHADHSNCAHAVAAKRQRKMFELKDAGKITLGDVTSLNITTLEAGVRVGDTFAYNCVPPVAKATFDIRISPHVEPSEIGNMVDNWCRECSISPDEGYKVGWKSVLGPMQYSHALTKTDDTNPWFQVFEDEMTRMGHKIVPQVFPAATDSRFLRQLGIKAFGFSPMRNTQIMLHENDEYLEEDVFIEGIEVYVGLIIALGSVSHLDMK
jgi:aminoacylase